MDRWYYRFDLQKYEAAKYGKKIDYNLAFQGGQDLQYWGNGLVLSEVLAGVNTTISWGGNDLTFLAGITPVRTADIDSSRPSFDHNTRRGFYGAMLSRDISGHRPYIYGLLHCAITTPTTNSKPVRSPPSSITTATTSESAARAP